MHTHKHCEYQSFEKVQVDPAAHAFGPVHPLPPHCPHLHSTLAPSLEDCMASTYFGETAPLLLALVVVLVVLIVVAARVVDVVVLTVVVAKVLLVRVETAAVVVRLAEVVLTPEEGRPKQPLAAVHFRSKKSRTVSVTV